MKIALLHLDLAGGPQEKNIDKLCKGIKIAAHNGATYIITPEMAIQGYFMASNSDLYEIDILNNDYLDIFTDLAKELQVNIFLCGARCDNKTLNAYNSCTVIDKMGKIVGVHNKNKTVGGKTEAWSTAGKIIKPIVCNKVKCGVLVCADAWYDTNAYKLALAGAEIIILPAAWPPGCGGPPEMAWKRCSYTSKLPVIVCNQTGTSNGMDCTIAQSAVVIDDEIQTSYSGRKEAILVTELKLSGDESNCKPFKIYNSD